MNKDDMELLLISGLPYYIDRIGEVYPITVKDIIKHGYSIYNYYLNVIFLNPKALSEEYEELKDSPIIDFVFINRNFGKDFTKAILFFLNKETATIDYKNSLIKIDDIVIDHDNFDELKKFIGFYSKVTDLDESFEEEEIDEKTLEIKRKLEERKRRFKGSDPPINLHDIISSLTVKSQSLNKLNIFDLTIYQLHEEFERQNHVENYYRGVESLMNGAKKEEVNLKHWSSKMEKD